MCLECVLHHWTPLVHWEIANWLDLRVNGGERRKKEGLPGIGGQFSMEHLQWCLKQGSDVSAGSQLLLRRRDQVSEHGSLGIIEYTVANIPWMNEKLITQDRIKNCCSQQMGRHEWGHCDKWNKLDTRRQVTMVYLICANEKLCSQA